jgi:hypothetical protein
VIFSLLPKLKHEPSLGTEMTLVPVHVRSGYARTKLHISRYPIRAVDDPSDPQTRRLTRAAGRQRGRGECANGWLAQDLASSPIVREGSAVAGVAEIVAEEGDIEWDRLSGNKIHCR